MILPQSQTFNVLKTRLDCVNITNFSLPFINADEEVKEDKEATKQFIIKCLSQYDVKQEKLKLYQTKMETNSKNNAWAASPPIPPWLFATTTRARA